MRLRLLCFLVGCGVLLLLLPATAPRGQHLAGASTQSQGLDCLAPNNWLKCALADIDNSLLDQTIGLLGSSMQGAATTPTQQAQPADGPVPLGGFVFWTDHLDSYDHPIVKAWHDTISIPAADAVLTVIVLVSGYLVLFGELFSDGYLFAKYVVPRLVLGFFAVHASLWLCQLLIDLNNNLIAPFGATGLVALLHVLVGVRDPGDIGRALMVLIFILVVLIFIVQMIGRLALLNLLIILSPFGFVCWTLPQLHDWGQWYAKTLVATIFVQFFQVVALSLSMVIVQGMGSNILDGASAFAVIWSIATMVLALRLPDLLRSLGVFGGNGTGLTAAVALMAAARMTASLSTGGAGAVAAGASSAASAGSAATRPLQGPLPGRTTVTPVAPLGLPAPRP